MEVAALKSRKRFTIEEYLKLSAESATKLEYRDGEILDMAGATYDHDLIAANLLGELRNRLKGSTCNATGSDTRVLAADARYAYPDITVVCGGPIFDPGDGEMTITNPRVLVEVLSPSTEATDRSEKLVRYFNMKSLQEYFLISQSKPRVESFFRKSDGTWDVGPVVESLSGSAKFASIAVEVPLSEIYADISFELES